ncbi:uncharacterized protein V1516DRAFT_672413 [Lipomyces oligophaga]|uniref:uncharacterized protein n=1 Tax=Lipomyces oligophaga TaxID=45792 RepID=UPI0034CE7177
MASPSNAKFNCVLVPDVKESCSPVDVFNVGWLESSPEPLKDQEPLKSCEDEQCEVCRDPLLSIELDRKDGLPRINSSIFGKFECDEFESVHELMGAMVRKPSENSDAKSDERSEQILDIKPSDIPAESFEEVSDNLITENSKQTSDTNSNSNDTEDSQNQTIDTTVRIRTSSEGGNSNSSSPINLNRLLPDIFDKCVTDSYSSEEPYALNFAPRYVSRYSTTGHPSDKKFTSSKTREYFQRFRSRQRRMFATIKTSLRLQEAYELYIADAYHEEEMYPTDSLVSQKAYPDRAKESFRAKVHDKKESAKRFWVNIIKRNRETEIIN